MYTVENKEYGIKITISRILTDEESIQLKHEFIEKVSYLNQKFLVLVDVTKIEILSPIVKSVVVQIQEFALVNGLVRSSVIVNDELTKMQFSLIAKTAGIDSIEHYFSTDEIGYEKKAMDWILYGKSSTSNTVKKSD